MTDIPFRIADHGQADARIASRAFDNHAARAKRAALFRVLDDGKRGTILDRSARIHELRLAKDVTAGCLGNRPQADEGGVADSVQQILRVWIMCHLSRSRLPTI